MALSDVNFQEGDGQLCILEIPTGTLNAPNDILCVSADTYPVNELPLIEGGGDIFIMSE